MKSKLKVTQDFTKEFNELVKTLKGNQVLVGIPPENSPRDDSQINNATLLAIHEFGSPANNIPARPVLELGIQRAKEDVASEFKKATAELFSNGPKALDLHLNRAGVIVQKSVRKIINSQEGILPPSEATLAKRRAQGFFGQKALLVTEQLYDAIDYTVVKKNGIR